MSWTELEMKVIRWAEDRRIIPNATPVSQLLKAVSEMGELADAMHVMHTAERLQITYAKGRRVIGKWASNAGVTGLAPRKDEK